MSSRSGLDASDFPYKDVKKFQKAIDSYFEECKADEDRLPDFRGMFVSMGILEEDVDAYLEAHPEKADKYRRALKFAQYRRESWLSRNMVSDNKKSYGCMNALKQEQNGGYTDRPVADKKQRIEIVLPDGATMDMFK